MTFDVEGPVPGNVTVRKDRPKSVAKDGQELVLQADDAQRMDGLFILRESDPVTRLLPELAMEGNTIKVNKRLETNIPVSMLPVTALDSPCRSVKPRATVLSLSLARQIT